MAKGYSARRGFSNGAGQAAQQMQMQQKLMQMQQEMAKAQQEVEEATFTASVGGGVPSALRQTARRRSPRSPSSPRRSIPRTSRCCRTS